MTKSSRSCRRRAFTLVELLAAMTVLVIMIVSIASITQSTSQIWQSSEARTQAFQNARAGFESMTRNISQAVLNNYYGYDNASAPKTFLRQSDLQFVTGKTLYPGQVSHAIFFQAPLNYTDTANLSGMDSLLNACGYYVQYGNDTSTPAFLTNQPARYRYRLMQFCQPTENFSVYDTTQPNPTQPKNSWFTAPLPTSSPPPVRQLAENVVALVVYPELSAGDQAKAAAAGTTAVLAPAYEYDSTDSTNPTTLNQLPPIVRIVMVSIDETSALHMGNPATAPELGCATLFKNAAQLDQDLRTMEANLVGKRLNYRIFQTEVAIRTAKWTTYVPGS